MVAKFWIKQLLIKPDPSPYLLANKMPAVRLYAAPNEPLYWTNPQRVIADTLSGKTLGQSPFELRFDVHSKAITDGTTQLLDAHGLVKCIAQDETLYFKFAWELPWYSLDKKYLKSGWNYIVLASDGEKISLQVNEYVAIIINTAPKYVPWVQPVLTSNTSYGVVTSSANRGTSDAQAEWHALDGKLPVASDQYTYFGWGEGVPQWWKWVLPVTIKINKIGVYNRATAGTTNYTKLLQFFTNDTRTTQLTPVLTLPNNSTEETVYTLTEPVLTNQIYAYMTDTYGEPSGYGGIGEINITAEVLQETPYPYISVGQISSPVSWTKVRNIKAVIL